MKYRAKMNTKAMVTLLMEEFRSEVETWDIAIELYEVATIGETSILHEGCREADEKTDRIHKEVMLLIKSRPIEERDALIRIVREATKRC